LRPWVGRELDDRGCAATAGLVVTRRSQNPPTQMVKSPFSFFVFFLQGFSSRREDPLLFACIKMISHLLYFYTLCIQFPHSLITPWYEL
jgi:hypothetical protein